MKPIGVGPRTLPPSTGAAGDSATSVSGKSPGAAELAELAKTDKPRADLIERAQTAYADLLAQGARIVVTTSAGNGGKPVAVLLPAGFDPAQPAKVQTHYHGDRTSAAEPNGGTTQAIKELVAKDAQRVFVLPEAKANVGGSPMDWTNVQSQAQTTSDALAAAGVTKVGERTVSAHSSGGRALAMAAAAPGGVAADRVVLLDCLYEPAATRIREGLTANGAGVKELVVVRGTNEEARADAMVAAFKDRARKVLIGPTRGENAHDAAVRFLLDGREAKPAGWAPR
jgi:hypothetical protein